jgi:hypothetical protein
VESQQVTKKITEAQTLDKTTDIQAKDGPCTAIINEEEDEFCNASTKY